MGYQDELEDAISAAISGLGYAPVRGIVIQVAPDSDPHVGTLVHGVAETPFISITSTSAEQPRVVQGFADLQAFERVVTVGIIGNNLTVEQQANLRLYRYVRQKIIARLHVNDLIGPFATNVSSCVHQAIVRPKSQVDMGAWIGRTKYWSAFDVVCETREVTV